MSKEFNLNKVGKNVVLGLIPPAIIETFNLVESPFWKVAIIGGSMGAIGVANWYLNQKKKKIF